VQEESFIVKNPISQTPLHIAEIMRLHAHIFRDSKNSEECSSELVPCILTLLLDSPIAVSSWVDMERNIMRSVHLSVTNLLLIFATSRIAALATTEHRSMIVHQFLWSQWAGAIYQEKEEDEKKEEEKDKKIQMPKTNRIWQHESHEQSTI
jgi:hypothetical protein